MRVVLDDLGPPFLLFDLLNFFAVEYHLARGERERDIEGEKVEREERERLEDGTRKRDMVDK